MSILEAVLHLNNPRKSYVITFDNKSNTYLTYFDKRIFIYKYLIDITTEPLTIQTIYLEDNEQFINAFLYDSYDIFIVVTTQSRQTNVQFIDINGNLINNIILIDSNECITCSYHRIRKELLISYANHSIISYIVRISKKMDSNIYNIQCIIRKELNLLIYLAKQLFISNYINIFILLTNQNTIECYDLLSFEQYWKISSDIFIQLPQYIYLDKYSSDFIVYCKSNDQMMLEYWSQPTNTIDLDNKMFLRIPIPIDNSIDIYNITIETIHVTNKYQLVVIIDMNFDIYIYMISNNKSTVTLQSRLSLSNYMSIPIDSFIANDISTFLSILRFNDNIYNYLTDCPISIYISIYSTIYIFNYYFINNSKYLYNYNKLYSTYNYLYDNLSNDEINTYPEIKLFTERLNSSQLSNKLFNNIQLDKQIDKYISNQLSDNIDKNIDNELVSVDSEINKFDVAISDYDIPLPTVKILPLETDDNSHPTNSRQNSMRGNSPNSQINSRPLFTIKTENYSNMNSNKSIYSEISNNVSSYHPNILFYISTLISENQSTINNIYNNIVIYNNPSYLCISNISNDLSMYTYTRNECVSINDNNALINRNTYKREECLDITLSSVCYRLGLLGIITKYKECYIYNLLDITQKPLYIELDMNMSSQITVFQLCDISLSYQSNINQCLLLYGDNNGYVYYNIIDSSSTYLSNKFLCFGISTDLTSPTNNKISNILTTGDCIRPLWNLTDSNFTTYIDKMSYKNNGSAIVILSNNRDIYVYLPIINNPNILNNKLFTTNTIIEWILIGLFHSTVDISVKALTVDPTRKSILFGDLSGSLYKWDLPGIKNKYINDNNIYSYKICTIDAYNWCSMKCHYTTINNCQIYISISTYPYSYIEIMNNSNLITTSNDFSMLLWRFAKQVNGLVNKTIDINIIPIPIRRFIFSDIPTYGICYLAPNMKKITKIENLDNKLDYNFNSNNTDNIPGNEIDMWQVDVVINNSVLVALKGEYKQVFIDNMLNSLPVELISNNSPANNLNTNIPIYQSMPVIIPSIHKPYKILENITNALKLYRNIDKYTWFISDSVTSDLPTSRPTTTFRAVSSRLVHRPISKQTKVNTLDFTNDALDSNTMYLHLLKSSINNEKNRIVFDSIHYEIDKDILDDFIQQLKHKNLKKFIVIKDQRDQETQSPDVSPRIITKANMKYDNRDIKSSESVYKAVNDKIDIENDNQRNSGNRNAQSSAQSRRNSLSINIITPHMDNKYNPDTHLSRPMTDNITTESSFDFFTPKSIAEVSIQTESIFNNPTSNNNSLSNQLSLNNVIEYQSNNAISIPVLSNSNVIINKQNISNIKLLTDKKYDKIVYVSKLSLDKTLDNAMYSNIRQHYCGVATFVPPTNILSPKRIVVQKDKIKYKFRGDIDNAESNQLLSNYFIGDNTNIKLPLESINIVSPQILNNQSNSNSNIESVSNELDFIERRKSSFQSSTYVSLDDYTNISNNLEPTNDLTHEVPKSREIQSRSKIPSRPSHHVVNRLQSSISDRLDKSASNQAVTIDNDDTLKKKAKILTLNDSEEVTEVPTFYFDRNAKPIIINRQIKSKPKRLIRKSKPVIVKKIEDDDDDDESTVFEELDNQIDNFIDNSIFNSLSKEDKKLIQLLDVKQQQNIIEMIKSNNNVDITSYVVKMIQVKDKIDISMETREIFDNKCIIKVISNIPIVGYIIVSTNVIDSLLLDGLDITKLDEKLYQTLPLNIMSESDITINKLKPNTKYKIFLYTNNSNYDQELFDSTSIYVNTLLEDLDINWYDLNAESQELEIKCACSSYYIINYCKNNDITVLTNEEIIDRYNPNSTIAKTNTNKYKTFINFWVNSKCRKLLLFYEFIHSSTNSNISNLCIEHSILTNEQTNKLIVLAQPIINFMNCEMCNNVYNLNDLNENVSIEELINCKEYRLFRSWYKCGEEFDRYVEKDIVKVKSLLSSRSKVATPLTFSPKTMRSNKSSFSFSNINSPKGRASEVSKPDEYKAIHNQMRNALLKGRLELVEECKSNISKLIEGFRYAERNYLKESDMIVKKSNLRREDIQALLGITKLREICKKCNITLTEIMRYSPLQLSSINHPFQTNINPFDFLPSNPPMVPLNCLPGTNRHASKPWLLCNQLEQFVEIVIASQLNCIIDLCIDDGIIIPTLEELLSIDYNIDINNNSKVIEFITWYAGDELNDLDPSRAIPTLARVLFAEEFERVTVKYDKFVYDHMIDLGIVHNINTDDINSENLIDIYEGSIQTKQGNQLRFDVFVNYINIFISNKLKSNMILLYPPAPMRYCDNYMFPMGICSYITPSFELPPDRIHVYPTKSFDAYTVDEILQWLNQTKDSNYVDDDLLMVNAEALGVKRRGYLDWLAKEPERVKASRVDMLNEDKLARMSRKYYEDVEITIDDHTYSLLGKSKEEDENVVDNVESEDESVESNKYVPTRYTYSLLHSEELDHKNSEIKTKAFDKSLIPNAIFSAIIFNDNDINKESNMNSNYIYGNGLLNGDEVEDIINKQKEVLNEAVTKEMQLQIEIKQEKILQEKQENIKRKKLELDKRLSEGIEHRRMIRDKLDDIKRQRINQLAMNEQLKYEKELQGKLEEEKRLNDERIKLLNFIEMNNQNNELELMRNEDFISHETRSMYNNIKRMEYEDIRSSMAEQYYNELDIYYMNYKNDLEYIYEVNNPFDFNNNEIIYYPKLHDTLKINTGNDINYNINDFYNNITNNNKITTKITSKLSNDKKELIHDQIATELELSNRQLALASLMSFEKNEKSINTKIRKFTKSYKKKNVDENIESNELRENYYKDIENLLKAKDNENTVASMNTKSYHNFISIERLNSLKHVNQKYIKYANRLAKRLDYNRLVMNDYIESYAVLENEYYLQSIDKNILTPRVLSNKIFTSTNESTDQSNDIFISNESTENTSFSNSKIDKMKTKKLKSMNTSNSLTSLEHHSSHNLEKSSSTVLFGIRGQILKLPDIKSSNSSTRDVLIRKVTKPKVKNISTKLPVIKTDNSNVIFQNFDSDKEESFISRQTDEMSNEPVISSNSIDSVKSVDSPEQVIVTPSVTIHLNR